MAVTSLIMTHGTMYAARRLLLVTNNLNITSESFAAFCEAFSNSCLVKDLPNKITLHRL